MSMGGDDYLVSGGSQARLPLENSITTEKQRPSPEVMTPLDTPLRGRVNLCDEFRDGLPSTVVNDRNINAVRLMVKIDRIIYRHLNLYKTNLTQLCIDGRKPIKCDDDDRGNMLACFQRHECCARGRPIIVEWERDARHSAGLSLVRKKPAHAIFPGVHPAKYSPRSTPLNFGGRTRTGVFTVT
ncbi:hypothetical protein EVAR_11333_1 [Eumeta japonica]|uniref:Uncharacterized protein n=1 Tax=Eumeta variegata TaxID=151549 RepID=A0A4C1U0Q6_EUMVA|nr:hypothetical protein EVAR_11333_1 [Eumeta japonica]